MHKSPLEAKLKEFDELQHTLSQDEFIARFKAEVQPLLEKEMLAHGAHEPDWGPLEKVLPFAECTGFMFMGYEGSIRIYKHGHTRKCLYLDPQGKAFTRHSFGWQEIDLSRAIEEVFEGLDDYGFTRRTPVTAETTAIRHRIIKERTGYEIHTISPSRPA